MGCAAHFHKQLVVVVGDAFLNVVAGARVLVPATSECRKDEARPR